MNRTTWPNGRTKSEIFSCRRRDTLKSHARSAPISLQTTSTGRGRSGCMASPRTWWPPLLLDSIRKDAESSDHSNGNRHLFLVPHAEVLRIETAEGRATTLVVAVREVSRDPDVPGMS